ncbi:hypothetical protein CUROG_10215 [Corynebacterium urogenitale]|uniref:Uncharacterized protein n=1 Tax=Corynebacterium urogenitale TaxID=2487892 RepID=A0A5J6ZCC7_9CORY|nr:hypothetical protein [Corynebacterium urogenitale]QFQ03375.1 hypothetical protein CUROG_10215 [Corynebacterium urogenitale]
MSQNTAPGTDTTAEPTKDSTATAAGGVLFDPIMVVAIAAGGGVENTRGGEENDGAKSDELSNNKSSDDDTCTDSTASTTKPDSFTAAVWQVETDPEVARGDFSGAWLVTETGIQGFAAGAEWIDERHTPAEVLRTLLRYPVLPAEGTTAEQILRIMRAASPTDSEPASAPADPSPPQPVILDQGTIEGNARAAIDRAKKDFARLQPGKKQPAWGQIDNIQPVPGRVPEGHDPATAAVIASALSTARGLRIWLDQWQSFDKTRARRLGSVDSSHSELLPAPLT